MAGRPVTMQSGPTSQTYWVIVFAILMVASLGLFIFQLTNNKGLQNEAITARQRVEALGSPPAFYSDEARQRNTNVFAVVNDEQRRVAGAVSGVPEDMGPALIDKCNRALKDLAERKKSLVREGASVLGVLERLDEAHTEELDRADAAEAAMKSLQTDKDSLVEQLRAARTQFETEVARLSDQLNAAQNDKSSGLQLKDEQLRDAQAELDALKQQLVQQDREGTAIARDKDVEIGQLRNQVAMLQQQVKSLKPSTFDPDAILKKADGRILRAVPGSDVVYVNLGAADKIKVGMGFEVYSQTREVPSDLRGKASIEVVTVMEDTAECRVTRRVPNQPIIEGDIAVNIAYERDRKPKFVIRGEFDINHDGVVDFDGPQQIASLIRQWGGQVVEDLDESVDFVVVGLSPAGPKFDDNTILSDVVRDQARRKELAGLQFYKLLERAASMYIPVITQSQLMYLTGYAEP